MLAAVSTVCPAETPSFIAPPRTIADIAAILAQEKPDAGRIAAQRAKANSIPPSTNDRRALAQFYLERGEMRGRLGRVREAIADGETALEYAHGADVLVARSLSLLGFVYGWSGDPKKSLEAFVRGERLARQGRRYGFTRWIGINLIALGDLDQAEAAMRRNQEALAAAQRSPDWASNPFRSGAEANVTFGDAAILEARGRFREAAVAYENAERLFRELLTKLSEIPNPPTRSSVEQGAEWMAARAARVKAREGRLAEAEFDVRRALVGWLKLSGKYDLNTARIISVFTTILVEQGRYAEAENLARTVIDIYEGLGAERDSQVFAISLTQLAGILALQNRWREAARAYAMLDHATAAWDQARKDEVDLDVSRILTAYNVNDVSAGVTSAERLLTRQASRFGEDHAETALARGVLAVGLSRAGHKTEALRLFSAAAPILVSGTGEALSNEDDAVGVAARQQRIQFVIESYMSLLASRGSDAAAESLRLAEAIRGQSVQRALSALTARLAARDPALSELARTEQDLQKQIGAQLGVLNNLLAAPPAERDGTAIENLRAQIEKLRSDREQARTALVQGFPDYAEFVAAKPPTVDEIRAALKPDEAYLSLYLGQEASFVWALSKHGALAFAAVPTSVADAETKVAKLREALEPQVTTVADIPPFDLTLGYELYRLLLHPVESAWRPAKTLVVATNGALGLLPLGLLPTAPVKLRTGGEPLFATYREVPWLARTHAVTVVPSAAALRALRQLPPGAPTRDKLIAFGDPYFSERQAAEGAREKGEEVTPRLADASTTRGVPLQRRSRPQTQGVDSAELALLPRLPDTADELESIARTLGADPAKVLHLGKAANERAVKTIDLSKFKIIAFATHGLVPGDLDGLTQPALALTAPSVAGVDGDGVLTMAEILSLRLDADWVVLSACNTGAGAAAGAEAASGLGRAFFYAGTRAILVTNWSVHSASARELVTDLFRRQTADGPLTKAEALRQSMMTMLDHKGFTDKSGNMLFSYGHPLFWAPYTIIGDGG
ncbi:MAG: CHAT domain-containing protein [Croceibacterium sp.]